MPMRHHVKWIPRANETYERVSLVKTNAKWWMMAMNRNIFILFLSVRYCGAVPSSPLFDRVLSACCKQNVSFECPKCFINVFFFSISRLEGGIKKENDFLHCHLQTQIPEEINKNTRKSLHKHTSHCQHSKAIKQRREKSGIKFTFPLSFSLSPFRFCQCISQTSHVKEIDI